MAMRNINNVSVMFKVVEKDGKHRFEIDYNDMQDTETGEVLDRSVLNEMALYNYNDIVMTALPSEITIYTDEETVDSGNKYRAKNGHFTIGEILDIVLKEENMYLKSYTPDAEKPEDVYFAGLVPCSHNSSFRARFVEPMDNMLNSFLGSVQIPTSLSDLFYRSSLEM